MNHLHRELAPITAEGWSEIEQEATQTLTQMLAGRKLFDFEGPHGWNKAAINLGRVERLKNAPADDAIAQRRLVQPMIETRVPFEIDRAELEAAERGADDINVDTAATAARQAAMVEDNALFNGYPEAGITGIMSASTHEPISIGEDYTRYPDLVAEASEQLRLAGVEGPYAVALGPRCYTELMRTTQQGYPVMKHVGRLVNGPIVWAPAVDGAVVMSQRGGDFVLHVGQDFAIGHSDHDQNSVQLYIQSSFTSLVLSPEAAVPLRHN